MDILNNVYTLTVKNKHLILTGLLLLISAILKAEREKEYSVGSRYLGDNVPLSLIERIKECR